MEKLPLVLSEGNKSTIENCFKEKGWDRRIVKEYSGKKWSHWRLNN